MGSRVSGGPVIARFGRDPFALLIVFIAGLGTAHILVRTATYGATVSTDSTIFLSTALNFLAGEGWRDFTGWSPVSWPPLFPLLLAALGWVGIDPLAAGRLVNATAFGLTILAAGLYLHSNLRSRGLALAASLAVLAALPLSDFASNFLTDALFVLLTLLALIWLASFLNRGARTSLWWAAVFTALAALTRYPGVVLIGVGVLVLLVRRAPPLAARLKDAIVFGAVSSLPLAGVLTHNWAISGTLTGPRSGSGESLFDGLSRVADVFRAWVMPWDAVEWFAYLLWRTTGLSTPDWFGSLLWATTGLVVVAMVAVVVLSGRGQSLSFGLGPALPFGMFVVAYLVFIIAAVPFTVNREIPARYLLPVYVPLLLAAMLLLDRFLSIKVAGRVGAAKWGLASLVLLGVFAHTGFSAHRNLRLTAKALEPGYLVDGAYNTADWQQSATLNYIRDNRIEGRIYSNNPFLVWFASRTVAINKLPNEIRDWTRYAGRWVKRGEDEVYIVWIKDNYRSGFYDYNDLDIRFLPGVEPVAESPDGVVFRVTAADAVEPFDEGRLRAQKERYQERYVDQLLEWAGEQVVRSGWDVYRNGRKLTYFKKPCAPVDVQAKFVLHVIPTDPADLPAHRRRFGFDNLDFHFDWLDRTARVQGADQCVAIVRLPDYAIGRVRVGQWIADGNRTLWGAEFSPGR